ncbi:hypothetical protein C1646_675071 [Rhizophagus diaphanus]|nr:hypothetical protein C1646_675071 [Rhizophagus diaphanus] [Rhizophagus sp. MUCL 43196]
MQNASWPIYIVSQEILEVVRNLLLNKKISEKKGCKPLADTSNLQEKIIKKSAPPKLDSSAPVAKKRSISKVLDAPADVPLRNDKSIDILEILKTAKPNSPHLEGLLKLLATASIPKLEGHFE